jgi:hypothetical protein
VVYARRLILQRNVFAIVEDEVAGRALTAALRREFGPIDLRLRLIDANICSRKDLPLESSRPSSSTTPRKRAQESIDSADFDERAEILRFAWREFRRMRLGGVSSGEMITAASQLRTRRATLLARRVRGGEMTERRIDGFGRPSDRDRNAATIGFADPTPRFKFDLTLGDS